MSETPPEEADQDAEPPVGAPAPDPGGDAANPQDESQAGRVEPDPAAGSGDG